MCGRFTLTTPARQFARLFPSAPAPDWTPRYNIAPSQSIAALRQTADRGLEWAALRWGLIPRWADDPKIGYKMINARGETIAEKPSFRSAFQHRRCLIPADGFYEWQKVDGRKQPIFIHLPDRRSFFFAGLWERNEKTGEPIESCTIITTEANDTLRGIHHRMPVMFSLEPPQSPLLERWLDPEFDDPQQLQTALRPWADDELLHHWVDPRVNQAKYDQPDCIQPA